MSEHAMRVVDAAHAYSVRPIADRFVRLRGAWALDLALGSKVLLDITEFGSPSTCTRWVERCATLFKLRHPGLMPLVDFGTLNGSNGFAAFAQDATQRVAPRGWDASRQIWSCVRFLHRLELSAGHPARRRFVNRRRGAVIRPDEKTGQPLGERAIREEARRWRRWLGEGSRLPRTWAADPWGVVLQEPAALSDVIEWLEAAHGAGPRCLQVCGPPGAGVTTLVTLAAHEARRRGFFVLNVNQCLAGPGRDGDALPAGRWVAGRPTLVVADERVPRTPAEQCHLAEAHARLLLRLSAHDSRPHLTIVLGTSPRPHSAYIEVKGLSSAQLRRSVVAAVGKRFARRVVEQALRSAVGSPARFLQSLQNHHRSVAIDPTMTDRVQGVAESVAHYDVTRPLNQASLFGSVAGITSSDRDVVVRHLQEAGRLACSGRHAAAERDLRQTWAAQERRGHLGAAGCAAVLLGRLLISRGRLRAAVEIFETAREHFERAASGAGVALASAHLGFAHTSAGRFREAEALSRSALLAAERLGEEPVRLFSALALARGFFWQGRFEETRHLVSQPGEIDTARSDLPRLWPDLTVGFLALRTRLAVAEHHLHAATAAARGAMDQAEATSDRAALIRANVVSLEVYASIGDIRSLKGWWVRGRTAAKASHAPIESLCLRLAAVWGLTNAGRSADALAVARPILGLNFERLPALLAARARMVLARVIADPRLASQLRAAGDRFIQESGAHGVEAFYAPVQASLAVERSRPIVRHVIDVLTLCQDTDDERAALRKIGGLVRERTRAAGVAFYASEPTGLSLVSAVGSKAGQLSAARRAVESGLSIPPARHANIIEAAVPVRCGSATVGALACRWNAEMPADAAGIEELLKATAAACAPCLRTVADRLKPPVPAVSLAPEILGVSESIQEVRRAILKAASAPFSVLIDGESGTGKELVARAIHRHGPRCDRGFAALNCAALVDELIEAELFGHARGAFTGAIGERAGLFESAHGGNVFLDEVCELSPRAQAKLLRVIQEGEVRRVGESFPRAVDVRLIGATNRPLADEVAAGRFRQDLMYRLDVIRITVPPLRARVEDIPVLANHFWEESCRRLGSRATLRPGLVSALADHDWPGNVRELQNLMAALAVAAPRRGALSASALPRALERASADGGPMTLEEGRRRLDEKLVRSALARAGGNRGGAARELGISRQGFAKLMARLGVQSI